MLQRLVQWAAQFRREPRWLACCLAVFAFLSFSLFFFFDRPVPIDYFDDPGRAASYILPGAGPDNATWTVADYARNPIKAPYKDRYWEFGQRCRALGGWLAKADGMRKKSRARREFQMAIETVSTSLFPFLAHENKSLPLSELRYSYEKGSRGIVIPVGGTEHAIRYAGHLVAALRDVLGTQLPIQIAYAGETDLPNGHRNRLIDLNPSWGLEFLDVLSHFDDSTLKLTDGGWAIKPFAALASRFEQVILADSDAVFLQTPEVLLSQPAYKNNGAYLFHDRLLWQHKFKDRHEWFHDQIKEPSAALSKSLVWTEDYAEECDSGVVVLDKSRPEVLVGMLNVAWQNTYDVREEVTYHLTYGDKESWWLGLELAGAGYEFEAHYGSMLGWAAEGQGQDGDEVDRVCSFVIAHTDSEDKLLWYNGSLLKNKLKKPDDYEVPECWMMDGVWHKGSKKQMSCMTGAELKHLTDNEKQILSKSIDRAKEVDKALEDSKPP